MIYKIFGIFKLPHSFNFYDILATFILIYCMAFTANLFYSTLLFLLSTRITVAYGGCSYRPASLYQTLKMMLIISTNELSGIYSTWPASLHSRDGNLNFFLRAFVTCTWITSERVTPGETEQRNLPMHVISASSPLGPKIQWFLYGSCFIPGDVIKLPALCQMLDVFQQ